MVAIEREAVNWADVRAEYAAGGISQKALARKHGVSVYALKKRAKAEDWAAGRARGAESEAAAGADEARRGGAAQAAGADAEVGPGDGAAEDGDDDARIAVQLRKQLLVKLQRAAEAIPCDATEYKTTEDGGGVKLLKLRDLTAAYKELMGDLPAEGAAGASRVVIDV